MGDQGSSYSVLQDIPVMVSPHYRLPKQIVIEKELVSIPEEALALASYSFSVERQAISNVVGLREKQTMEQKSLNERLEAYKAEKLQQKRAAARKIAPGFLDTDTRILHPQPFHHHHHSKTLVGDEPTEESDSENDTKRITTSTTTTTTTTPEQVHDRPSSTSPHLQQQHQQQRLGTFQRYRSSSNPPDFESPPAVPQEKRASAQSNFDYLKFEQGLAPPDPWDTPENDMMALRSILGSQEPKEQHPPSTTMSTPHYASPYQQHQQQHQQQQQQQQQQQHYHPNNNNNNNNNSIYPPDVGPWIRPSMHTPPQQPQQLPPPSSSSSSSTPRFAPVIPPKLFKEDPNENVNTQSLPPPPPPPPLPPQPTTNSSSSSSSSPPPPQQQQQQDLKHRDSPPPLPPFPSTNDALVQELANMGFSHSQAMDALQKNENDLIRATNFLLDNT